MTVVGRSVVLLGPPGAGKGTQAEFLAGIAGLQHVSTGDLLRAAIRDHSDLGRQVKAVVESGRLVSDEVVAALVAQRLDAQAGGLLLDGFPRTVGQAVLLEGLLAERGRAQPLVVELRVPDAEVVQRLAARRTCSECGPRPAGEDTCAGCGRAVQVRADDREDVIRERLRVYAEQTAPLVAWYGERGQLCPVDGTGTPDSVRDRVRKLLPLLEKA